RRRRLDEGRSRRALAASDASRRSSIGTPRADSPASMGEGKGTMPDTYRLVTRSDFDGLVCAALLKELGILDDIKFVHPKDMQDGKVDVGGSDITTNLPYVASAHLAFDHHSSEADRVGSDNA